MCHAVHSATRLVLEHYHARHAHEAYQNETSTAQKQRGTASHARDKILPVSPVLSVAPSLVHDPLGPNQIHDSTLTRGPDFTRPRSRTTAMCLCRSNPHVFLVTTVNTAGALDRTL